MMKKEMQQQTQDPEREEKEFEQIVKDINQSIAESCARPGKSGLTFEQFKAHFLKNLSKSSIPLSVHGSN
ncbi:MAG: hypothetical protein ACOYK6_05650 [Chthoniobacterales bacterium]